MLWVCLIVLGIFDYVITETTPTAKTITLHPTESSGFYGHACNSDTFEPKWGSVSSVMAMINGSIVTVSSGIFLIYACFSRFLTTMTT